MTTSLIPVIDLPFLSSEINDAHKQVTFHARSMLLEAKRAGDALLAAKKLVKHGEFQAWVERHIDAPYDTVIQYMRVAKRSENVDLHTFEGGIRAFLEAHSAARPKPAEAPLTIDRTDAEYLLKLHAMATRGEGHERDVASRKLELRAKAFGLTGDAAVAQAQALLPDAHLSAYQAAAEREATVAKEATEKLHATEERLAALEAQLQQMMNRKAEIKAELVIHSKDELIDMLVDAYLQLETPG